MLTALCCLQLYSFYQRFFDLLSSCWLKGGFPLQVDGGGLHSGRQKVALHPKNALFCFSLSHQLNMVTTDVSFAGAKLNS